MVIRPAAPTGPLIRQPFAILLPTKSELSAIQLYYKDTLLSEIFPGPVPTVEITSQVPSRLMGTSFTLTWDGIPGQTYDVRFSVDGGQSWGLLSPPMTATSLEIDLSTLPGTSNGIFEMVASSGLLSAFYPVCFSVEN